MDGIMEGLEVLKQHCEFNEPTDCYVLLAVSRKRDTQEITNSKEIIFRDVIKHKDEIEKKYLKIKASISNYKDINGKSFPFYLYVTLNPLNARKAAISLITEIAKWLELEGLDKNIIKKYSNTYGEFYSQLMSPKNRGSKRYFMIDYDEAIITAEFMERLEQNTEVYMKIPTRHGWHIKCKPFDARVLEDLKKKLNFEIKKDSLLFVEYFINGRD
jgi:hypothetical protein